MVLVTDIVIAKIVSDYLLRQHLSKTFTCFENESQTVSKDDNFSSQAELALLPCLEDILEHYFLSDGGKDIKEDRAYLLWKQFDVVVSQLRTLTLGTERAKAFLRARRSKIGVKLSGWKDEQKKFCGRETNSNHKEQAVQTDEVVINDNVLIGHHEHPNPCYTAVPEPMHSHNQYADQHIQLILLSNEHGDTHNVSSSISTADTLKRCTPTKDRLQNDVLKESKSPKRKSNHPKRRCDASTNLISLTKLPETPLVQSANKGKETSISPLLGTDDFSQMLKAMFSNSNFQEKLADNINKVTSGEGKAQNLHINTEKEAEKINVEEVVKKTADELDLSELYAMLGDLNHQSDDTKEQLFFPVTTMQHDDARNISSEGNDEDHTQLEFTVQNVVVDAPPESFQKVCDDDGGDGGGGISIQSHLQQPILTIVEDDASKRSQGFTQIENTASTLFKQSFTSLSCADHVVNPSSNTHSSGTLTSQLFPENITSSSSGSSNSILSCVRNLNRDLNKSHHVDGTQQASVLASHKSHDLVLPTLIGADCLAEYASDQSDICDRGNVESCSNISHFQKTLYERQESYHGMKSNTLECPIVTATPSKLTYISTEQQLTVTSESEPLHDSESIATDALLLLSTSPAKPEFAQSSQFSFLKLLTEPFNTISPSKLEYSPCNKTLPDNTNNAQFSVSDSGCISSSTNSQHDGNSQKTFFQKPHEHLKSTTLAPILPKCMISNIVPLVPRQPIINELSQKPDNKNLFTQLKLSSADVKKRQAERQRKSREKKLKEKKQKEFVVRNLAFGRTDEFDLLDKTNNIANPRNEVVQTSSDATMKTSICNGLAPSVDVVKYETGSAGSLLALKLTKNRTKKSKITEMRPDLVTGKASHNNNKSATSTIKNNFKSPIKKDSKKYCTHTEKLDVGASPSKAKLSSMAPKATIECLQSPIKSPLKSSHTASSRTCLQTASSSKQTVNIETDLASLSPRNLSPEKTPVKTTIEPTNGQDKHLSNLPKTASPRRSCLKQTTSLSTKRTSEKDASNRNAHSKPMKVKFLFPSKSPKRMKRSSNKNVSVDLKEMQDLRIPIKKLTVPIEPIRYPSLRSPTKNATVKENSQQEVSQLQTLFINRPEKCNKSYQHDDASLKYTTDAHNDSTMSLRQPQAEFLILNKTKSSVSRDNNTTDTLGQVPNLLEVSNKETIDNVNDVTREKTTNILLNDILPNDNLHNRILPNDTSPNGNLQNDILPNDNSRNEVLPNDILPNDNLHNRILPNDTSPNDNLQNDILPNDNSRNDVLPNDILPSDDFPRDNLPSDTLPDDSLLPNSLKTICTDLTASVELSASKESNAQLGKHQVIIETSFRTTPPVNFSPSSATEDSSTASSPRTSKSCDNEHTTENKQTDATIICVKKRKHRETDESGEGRRRKKKPKLKMDKLKNMDVGKFLSKIHPADI